MGLRRSDGDFPRSISEIFRPETSRITLFWDSLSFADVGGSGISLFRYSMELQSGNRAAGTWKPATGDEPMNIGVIELIAYTVPPEWNRRGVALTLRKMLYSVMPQMVAAWCRRRGHRTHYATYYGQADPVQLLPSDPKALIAFHDPNFAVRFDETMNVIEATVPQPNRYVMECSLSILKPERLERLKKTNCLYVAPGVESWFDYGNKSLANGRQERAKLDYVVGKFQLLRGAVRGLQANFLFGSDEDAGGDPADLTIDFIRRLPYVWPNVNIPTPYGGTPLFDRYKQDGRILAGMPLASYCAPYLVTTLKNYDPVTFYRHLVRIQTAITSIPSLVRRVASPAPFAVRFAHAVQTLSFREQARETRLILRKLETDRQFLAFHEGKQAPVPEIYQRHFDQRLGRYAEIMTKADRIPVLDPVSRDRQWNNVALTGRRHAAEAVE
jgi:hypothetical protein